MKVGILSDVHGDYGALTRVLEQMKRFHKVTRILCAGDLVGRGPEQNRVVACIRDNKIATVRGNHDEWIDNLNGDNSTYLKDLPLDWRGKIGAVRFYMCHGKPGNNMWGMYRDHLSETYLNMVLKSLKADVLVTGHTHMPLYMQVDEGILLNPGSLYTFESSRQTSHSYGVLDLDNLSFQIYDAGSDYVEPLELEVEY